MKTFNLKIVLLYTVLSLVTNNVFSQNEHPIEMLQEKKWVWTNPSKKISLIMEFGQSKGSQSLVFNNEEHRYEMLYYLSDSIPVMFDKQKLGKTTRGKYLVQLLCTKENEKDYTILKVLEIVELTSDSFKIKSLKNDTVLEYKAE